MTRNIRPRMNKREYDAYLEWKNSTKKSNTLFIGDIHSPFILDGYLDFCISIYNKYDCDRVVFAGDVIDNAFSSFHSVDPDGMGAGMELQKAIEKINGFYKAFPNAYVLYGNHCRIANRKAFAGGLSNRWIKTVGEILETPTWTYNSEFIFDNVLYVHGEGRTARNRCLKDFISVCQGHRHSQTYIEYYTSRDGEVRFALQVGTGIDREAYAFSYAKDYDMQQINCAVVLDSGKYAIIEPMF